MGHKIGKKLKAGTIIALIGDLGSGKTVFVQGLASGLDVPDDDYITSPTFTLINEYMGRHHFYHVDLYRIENREDIDEIGLYDILKGDGITAIEWADRLPKDILARHPVVHFEIIDDDSRRIFLSHMDLETSI